MKFKGNSADFVKTKSADFVPISRGNCWGYVDNGRNWMIDSWEIIYKIWFYCQNYMGCWGAGKSLLGLDVAPSI